MHTGMWVLACSPGPLPNVSPYMVPMCVLVGASLSEPHIYCVYIYRALCTCVRVSTVDGMASVKQTADVLTITFMLNAMQKHKILDVESLSHACSVAILSLETMHSLWM